MRYPIMQVPNMRYRGPIESHKLNKYLTELNYDFNFLFGETDKITTRFEDICSAVQKGKNNTGAPTIHYNDDGVPEVIPVPHIEGLNHASRTVANMRRQIAFMKGGRANV